MQQGVRLVTLDDFREAGAYAFGTPTRFGNVSAQLKNQIDQLTSLWLGSELEGKAAGIFVSTSSLHGGQETTILSLMAPMLHLRMILVGVPYSVQELFTTQGGGSPYGPGHVAGGDNKRQIDEQEAAICRARGNSRSCSACVRNVVLWIRLPLPRACAPRWPMSCSNKAPLASM